jgi:hypothetical protein
MKSEKKEKDIDIDKTKRKFKSFAIIAYILISRGSYEPNFVSN